MINATFDLPPVTVEINGEKRTYQFTDVVGRQTLTEIKQIQNEAGVFDYLVAVVTFENATSGEKYFPHRFVVTCLDDEFPESFLEPQNICSPQGVRQTLGLSDEVRSLFAATQRVMGRMDSALVKVVEEPVRVVSARIINDSNSLVVLETTLAHFDRAQEKEAA